MWGVLDGKALLGERCALSAEESGVAEAEVDDSTDGSCVCTDNCGGDSSGSRLWDCVDISRVPPGRRYQNARSVAYSALHPAHDFPTWVSSMTIKREAD